MNHFSSRSKQLKVILPIAAFLGSLVFLVMGYAIYSVNAARVGQSPDSHSLPIIGNSIPQIAATSVIDYYINPHQHGNVYGILCCKITKEKLDQFMLEAGLSELQDADNSTKQIYINSVERYRQDDRAFYSGQFTQEDCFFERPLEGTNEIYGIFRPEDGQFVLFIYFASWHASLTGDQPLK